MTFGIETGGFQPPGAEQFRAPGSEEPRELTPRQESLAHKKQILDFGDITSEDRAILAKPLFEAQEKVWIQHPLTGKVEDGWEVVSTDDQEVVLLKKEGQDPVRISELNLMELNP